MGAIQNSLNGITGTAAVGAYAVGKISDIKNADIAAGQAAEERKEAEKTGLQKEKEGLEVQQKAAGEEISAFIHENPELTAVDLDQRLAIEEAEGGDDLAKANEALKEMTNKINARQVQINRLNERLAAVESGTDPINKKYDRIIAQGEKWTGGKK